MAKIAILFFAAALVAISSAASFGGVKDLAGNYYDFTTGQYSSSLTGKVYNTAPIAPIAYAPHAAPYIASPYYPIAASPYYAAAPYSYGASYIAPAWK